MKELIRLRCNMDSTTIRLTIDRRKIAWLKFVLDSYDGLALLRTLDAASGRVILLVGPGAEEEIIGLLDALKDELGLVEGLSDDYRSITRRSFGRPNFRGWEHEGEADST